MKAMVLAAGLGTRLRPLTNDRPKALVEVCGRTLLEITLTRLRDFGINDVIINVHHYADMVMDHVKAAGNFGMHIEFSREDVLLDTGGGLKKAAWFLGGSGDPAAIWRSATNANQTSPSSFTTSMSSATSIFNEWLKFTNKARHWQRSPSRIEKHRVTCCSTITFSSAAAAWSKKKRLRSFGPHKTCPNSPSPAFT